MDIRDLQEVFESLTRQKRDEMVSSPLRQGDDTPALFSAVSEPPPSHWGSLTSSARTASEAYMRFIGKKK